MLASRIKKIKYSAVRKMFDLASSDAVNLGLGEPDFQPPGKAIEALKKALDTNKNKYSPTSGIPELREAIAERNNMYKKVLTKDEVMVTASGTEALMTTFLSFIEHGDEVLYPDPGFVVYKPQILLCEGRPVAYPLLEKNDYVPQMEDLKERISSKTKAIITNSPSNPCGSVLGDDEIGAIVDLAEDYELLIISDEVYDEIVYEGKHRSFLGRTENLIYVNSFSKTYAITGWRIGYLIAKKKWIKDMLKPHYYLIACPPTPIEYAVAEILRNDSEFIRRMITEFRKRRDLIVGELNSIPGFHCTLPKGAFYAFPSYTQNISSQSLAMRLLKHKVVCTPGSAFGKHGERHLRFSYANSIENIKEGLRRVKDIVEG